MGLNKKNLSPFLITIIFSLLFAACNQTPKPIAPTSSQESTQNASQKTISVTTHYDNPGGGDDVRFNLTVDDAGTIVEAGSDVLAVNPTSILRQRAFAAEFPKVVVGKKLADLTAIDRVGGSSLTTKAFNEALDQLKSQL